MDSTADDSGDWTTEGLDPEGPSAIDLERFGSETRFCPTCSAEVWDQTDVCHECGGTIGTQTADTLESRSRIGLLILLVLLGFGGAAAFL
ncbi:MAG: hypothetical protein AAF108_10560 [Planctomycetota bacterium]